MDKLQQSAKAGWSPHPAALLLVWISLALLSQSLHGTALLLLAVGMIALALTLGGARLLLLLRRTRWILLSLLLIYAYAMPGTPWFAQLGGFSPGREGTVDGLIQMTRLLIMLAGLAIVLALLSGEQLIAGLYLLFYPLRYLGISREKIVVRLALTLRYAESAMLSGTSHGLRSLENLGSLASLSSERIELQLFPLAWKDWLLLVVTGLLVLGVFL